jgi:hypothetical protein
VKVADGRGRRAKLSTVLEALSAGYCRVRLEAAAEPGATLSVSARISRAVVVLRGAVLGARPRPDGAQSVAVRIERYRFVHHPESNRD